MTANSKLNQDLRRRMNRGTVDPLDESTEPPKSAGSLPGARGVPDDTPPPPNVNDMIREAVRESRRGRRR